MESTSRPVLLYTHPGLNYALTDVAQQLSPNPAPVLGATLRFAGWRSPECVTFMWVVPGYWQLVAWTTGGGLPS